MRTISASPQITFDATVNVTSQNPITSVKVSLFNPLNEAAGEYQLSDAGAGIYTGNINIGGISCLIVGIYKVQIVAEDEDGLFSNLITISLPVVNTANQLIQLSNPDLPDSVTRPSTGFFDLTVGIDAIDPDGFCDIDKLLLYSIRPTGNPVNNGQPFEMTYSTGNKFTYTAGVFPAAEDSLYGYYKYIFQGVDRSGILSTQYIDSIKFVRP